MLWCVLPAGSGPVVYMNCAPTRQCCLTEQQNFPSRSVPGRRQSLALVHHGVRRNTRADTYRFGESFTPGLLRVLPRSTSSVMHMHKDGGAEIVDEPPHIAATSPEEPDSLTVTPTKHDPTKRHKAVEWHGTKQIRVQKRPVPTITDPFDVLVKVTSTAICGSDLHLYLNAIPFLRPRDVLGHEFMGTVEAIGPAVKHLFKHGERVVASMDIACGKCVYCKKQLYTECETTNPTGGYAEELWGDHTAGFHGFTHLAGGFEGGQAQYARVPHAQNDLLKVPAEMSDEEAVMLSDVLPTAWHACEMAGVGPGDSVAIWGAGPVGILTAQCAKHRGAARVVVVDDVDYRLRRARNKIPGVQTLTFREKPDVPAALNEMIPGGPDCGIECVGLHYKKTPDMTADPLALRLEEALRMEPDPAQVPPELVKELPALRLETDPSDMLDEIIKSVRKGGRIAVVGVYVGSTNHFNIGAFMEKHQSMRSGHTPVQKYWHMLLQKMLAKELDPTIVLTHNLPIDMAAHAYRIFNEKQEDCIKVVLRPWPSHVEHHCTKPPDMGCRFHPVTPGQHHAA